MDKINNKKIILNSIEDTLSLAKLCSKNFSFFKSNIFAFLGEIGAGKTTFIKYFLSSLLNIDINEITSPTFVYCNIYKYKPKNICHFDLYRLKNEDIFMQMGFLEQLSNNICLIEWAENIKNFLPKNIVKINLNYINSKKREICIKWDH